VDSDIPVAVDINVYTSIDVLLIAGWSEVMAFFFGDADVLAVMLFVSTGRGRDWDWDWGLVGAVAVLSIFPSSALNGHTLFSLDFSGGRSLFVPVSGRKDAERDTGEHG
jgi:hypothetical protein